MSEPGRAGHVLPFDGRNRTKETVVHMILQRVLGAVAVLGAGLALAACDNVSAGSPTTPDSTTVPTAQSNLSDAIGSTATTSTNGSPSANRGGGSSGGSGSGSGGSSGGGKSTSSTSPPATATATISVKKQPLCPRQGTPDAPFSTPGQDVTITWKVTGASGAALSVDQPGLYGAYGSNYGASGELTLPFACGNKPGKTSHTYTVWPAGVKTVSKSITVSATNNPSS
jgi:hypothetical protein